MSARLTAIKNEVNNDPVSKGYKTGATWKSHTVIADLFNEINISVSNNSVIATWEIFEKLDPAEYLAAINDVSNGARNRQMLTNLLGLGTVRADGANVRQVILTVFGSGSATAANLNPLRTRLGSRAEELSLGIVTSSDVADAQRL